MGFCLVGLCISAAELKRNTSIGGLEVDVELLPSGDNLVTMQDVVDDLVTVFGPADRLSVKEVDVKLMERVLLDNPFIKGVHVYVDARNILKVEATQREPMMRVLDLNAHHYYLDRAGVQIPVSPHYAAHVPVANGHIKALSESAVTIESPDLWRSLYSIALEMHDDEFMHALIDQLYVNEKQEILMIPKMGAEQIMIGDSSELSDKIERLKIFYKEVIPYEGYQTYKQLDLRYADQVVCKKK